MWSKVNKGHVDVLRAHGLMTSAGEKAIAVAKENGSWDILNRSDNLEVPDELAAAFAQNPAAKACYESLSDSKRETFFRRFTKQRQRQLVSDESNKRLPRFLLYNEPMNKVQPRRPSGFSEYLPGEQIEFNRLLTIIRSTYEKYGFTPLDTPDLELTDVLLAKGGGETEQQVYSFTREGSDTSLTLRYDLTVPLARYVAEHQSDLVFPFSRYHIGKVHRAERAQAGRGREFYQCDIDTIGSLSPAVDAQFPAVINEIFQQFGFGEFVIRINNRHILNGFLKVSVLHTWPHRFSVPSTRWRKLATRPCLSNWPRLGLMLSKLNKSLPLLR